MDKSSFEVFAEKLKHMQENIDKALLNKVVFRSEELAGRARKNCPVDEGGLRESIEGFVTQNENEITGGAVTVNEYAAYVEFGTGPTGTAEGGHPLDSELGITRKTGPWIGKIPITPDTAKYLGNITEKEREQGYAYRYIHGQQANPFMYRAMKETEQDIIDDFGSALKEVIKSG